MNNHLTVTAKEDSASAFNSTTTYGSNNVQLLRILLPTTTSLVAISLIQIIQLQHEGTSTPLSIAFIILIGVAVLVAKFIGQSAIVTLSDTTISIRKGFGLFATKGRVIPLEMIHTIQIVGSNRNLQFHQIERLHIGFITLIYRSPARKMMHASAGFAVSSMPNGVQLLLELARGTKAKIEVLTAKANWTKISLEELESGLSSDSENLSL